jgi:hypothetical protein
MANAQTPNWETWDSKDSFTLEQAAALFCNEDPLSPPTLSQARMNSYLKAELGPEYCTVKNLGHRNKPTILSMLGKDTELAVLRLIGKDETEFWEKTNHFPLMDNCVFTRKTLTEFVDRHKVGLPFLYPENRKAPAPDAEIKKTTPASQDDYQRKFRKEAAQLLKKEFDKNGARLPNKAILSVIREAHGKDPRNRSAAHIRWIGQEVKELGIESSRGRKSTK